MVAQAATRRVVDWNRLESLRELQAEGDPDVVAQVIAMFQEDSVERLARVREAVARGDGTTLRREAHALRGTAGVFGADALREAAETLERHAEPGWSPALGPLADAMAAAISDVRAVLASRTPEKHVPAADA